MKNGYRILVLTDHRAQTGENSIYPLVTTLVRHPECASLAVASRGIASNIPFFRDMKTENLYAQYVATDFMYDKNGKSYKQSLSRVDPLSFDVILLRIPRPVSNAFLHFMAGFFKDKVIINHPLGILNTSTKAFLLKMADLCPPMHLCRSVEEVQSFASRFPIVLKPLLGFGGKDIVKIEADRVSTATGTLELDEYFKKTDKTLRREGLLAMQYLKNVDAGDKRILVVNGMVMGASLRIPAPGSWLCNVAQGGRSVKTDITREEIDMIGKITPVLAKENILIYGADTLMNDEGRRVLSELNTLSIGGLRQIEEQSGRPVVKETVEEILKYVKNRHYERNPVD